MKNKLGTLLIGFALAPNVFGQDANKLTVAETKADTQKEEGAKSTSADEGSNLGMSILRNHEAPKALVLVPWKPSEPGKQPEISTKVDDSRSPVDKEVFVRMLRYQEIARKNAAPSIPDAAPRRKQ